MTIQIETPGAEGRREAPTERFATVIIGAGQAGLAAGYHLARRRQPFVILEAAARVGDVWRDRFDSLRLYSPARFDGLPGMPFPGRAWSFPTKDEFADYLESYASRFELPIRTGVAVDELRHDGDRYVIRSGARRFEADQVVVASGTWQAPVTPPFAAELDPSIRQLHSNDYRNPSQLAPGPVLVVGASHSGSDIAYEVARTGHATVLAGRIHGELPFRTDAPVARVVMPVLWMVANHVLTLRTPIGRKVRVKVREGGGPLIRHRRADLEQAGVDHVGSRVAGVSDGMPVLEDGRVVRVRNVMWCTGFHKDVSWVRIPSLLGPDGWPEERRGRAVASPGLYFVGLPFLQAFASMLIGGVGRDARHVARQIARGSRSEFAP